jgi:branched-chain amino acid transport system ATP-binding protein
MISRPKVLLLDEPSLVWPGYRGEDFEVIQKINRGVTVLLVEQNAHIALQIATAGM